MGRIDRPRILEVLARHPDGLDPVELAAEAGMSRSAVGRDVRALQKEGAVVNRAGTDGTPGRPRGRWALPPQEGGDALPIVTQDPPQQPPADAPPPDAPEKPEKPAAPVGSAPGAPKAASPVVMARADRRNGLELEREVDQVIASFRAVKGQHSNALVTVERLGPPWLDELGELGTIEANLLLSSVEDPQSYTMKRWGGGEYRWTARLASGHAVPGGVIAFRCSGDIVPRTAQAKRHFAELEEEDRDRRNRFQPQPVQPAVDPMRDFYAEQAKKSDRLLETLLLRVLDGGSHGNGKHHDADGLRREYEEKMRLAVREAIQDVDGRWKERLADIEKSHAKEIEGIRDGHRRDLELRDMKVRQEIGPAKGKSVEDRLLDIPAFAESIADLSVRAAEARMGLVPEKEDDFTVKGMVVDLVQKVGPTAVESLFGAIGDWIRSRSGAQGARPQPKALPGGRPAPRALPGPKAPPPAAPAAAPAGQDGAISPPDAAPAPAAPAGQDGAPTPPEGGGEGSPAALPPGIAAAQQEAERRVNFFLDAVEREFVLGSLPARAWDSPVDQGVTVADLWDLLPAKIRQPVEDAADAENPAYSPWPTFSTLLAAHPVVQRLVAEEKKNERAAQWVVEFFGSGPWVPDEEDIDAGGGGE